MGNGLLLIFVLAMVLMVMQSVGGILQIRGYKEAIKRMRKLGNVGFGQKRGRFFNGYVVIIACDSNRIITGCEVMDGITILARFHKVERLLDKDLLGVSIDEFLTEFRAMDSKKQKFYRGYIEALKSLESLFEKEKADKEDLEYLANDLDEDDLDAFES